MVVGGAQIAPARDSPGAITIFPGGELAWPSSGRKCSSVYKRFSEGWEIRGKE